MVSPALPGSQPRTIRRYGIRPPAGVGTECVVIVPVHRLVERRRMLVPRIADRARAAHQERRQQAERNDEDISAHGRLPPSLSRPPDSAPNHRALQPTPTPPRPRQGGGSKKKRSIKLPPPLRGRVGVGGAVKGDVHPEGCPSTRPPSAARPRRGWCLPSPVPRPSGHGAERRCGR